MQNRYKYLTMVLCALLFLTMFLSSCAERNTPGSLITTETGKPPLPDDLAWELASPPENAQVSALGLSELSYLVAGSIDGTAYRSKVRGEIWTEITLANRQITDFAMDIPARVMYAAVDGEGIYKSTTNARTWEHLGLDGFKLVAVATTATHTIYVADVNGALLSSEDGGLSWSAQETGLPANLLVTGMLQGVTGSTYLASDAGLYQLAPGSDSWQLTEMAGSINALAVNSAGVLYAADAVEGVFRSTDDARSWLSVNEGLEGLSISFLAAGNEHFMFAGSPFNGVYASVGSSVWVHTGLGGLPLSDLAFDLEDDIVFASSGTRIYMLQLYPVE